MSGGCSGDTINSHAWVVGVMVWYSTEGLSGMGDCFAAWRFVMGAMVDVVKVLKRIETFISTNLRLNSI